MTNPISSLAHKLRTPLTVITSTVNNLLDGAFGKLNEEQKNWLKKLVSHTAHLEKLQNDILELLKADSQGAEQVNKALEAQEVGHSSPNKPKPGFAVRSAQKMMDNQVPQILVVDDEIDIQEVIRDGLATKGFHTTTVSTGEEAYQQALASPPDLILMDVLLKNQNGMEVCRKIKSELTAFTPVILVTGQDDLKDKITGAPHDADDLLTKPFQMEELFSRVNSMLRIKKLHDELERAQADQP